MILLPMRPPTTFSVCPVIVGRHGRCQLVVGPLRLEERPPLMNPRPSATMDARVPNTTDTTLLEDI